MFLEEVCSRNNISAVKSTELGGFALRRSYLHGEHPRPPKFYFSVLHFEVAGIVILRIWIWSGLAPVVGALLEGGLWIHQFGRQVWRFPRQRFCTIAKALWLFER